MFILFLFVLTIARELCDENDSCYIYNNMTICVEKIPCEFCNMHVELTEKEIKEYEKTFETKYYN